MNVVVLGASRNPERYSNRAVVALKKAGHQVIPVHPAGGVIEGFEVRRSLQEVLQDAALQPDTITLYVSGDKSLPLKDDILALKPRRVIANPGAESPDLGSQLTQNGIEYLEACTLVMLSIGTF